MIKSKSFRLTNEYSNFVVLICDGNSNSESDQWWYHARQIEFSIELIKSNGMFIFAIDTRTQPQIHSMEKIWRDKRRLSLLIKSLLLGRQERKFVNYPHKIERHYIHSFTCSTNINMYTSVLHAWKNTYHFNIWMCFYAQSASDNSDEQVFIWLRAFMNDI